MNLLIDLRDPKVQSLWSKEFKTLPGCEVVQHLQHADLVLSDVSKSIDYAKLDLPIVYAVPELTWREWHELREGSKNCLGFLSLEHDLRQTLQVFPQFLSKLQNRRQIEGNLKSQQAKFHEMHAVVQDLEEMLNERKSLIRESRIEEDRRIGKFRELMHFVVELAEAQDVEQVLKSLHLSFRPYFTPASVFWCKQIQGRFHLSIFEKGELREFWIQIDAAQIGETHPWSYELAKVLRRPCLPVMSFVLSNQNEFFGVEVDASHLVGDAVKKHFQERIYALSLSLERIRDERAIQMETRMWAKTFDSLSDPVAILDEGRRLLRGNRSFQKFQGEAMCFEYFSGQSKICEGCQLGENTLVLRNQESFELTSAPLQLQSAQKHYVHFYRDLSQKMSLEAQWIISKKMAALGALAGHLSHELSNPLAGLKSLSQYWIHELPGTSSWIGDLKEIEEACSRSQDIISNLIEFSSGGGRELEDVSVDEVMRKTLVLLKSQLRGLRTEVNFSTSGYFVKASSTLLSQVFFNLINNAAQAMDHKGNLRVSTYVLIDASTLRIEVQDSGPGIPRNIQMKVFEAFFTTKPVGFGSGLGLSFSKKVIQSFHGQIGVVSEPGHGATFWVELPVSSKAGARQRKN